MNPFSVFSGRRAQTQKPRGCSRLGGHAGTPTAPGRRSRQLQLEMLEDRCLPAATTISGYVFYDINNTGIMVQGNQPLAGSNIELHNAANAVIGTATTGSDGYFKFDHDASVTTTPQTISKTFTITNRPTDFSLTGLVGQFDTSLGTLLSVQIINAGSITSSIAVENLSSLSPSTINAIVAGQLTLTGPNGLVLLTNVSQNVGTFNASALQGPFTGQLDFTGPNAHNFGANTANGSQSITLTGSAMAPFAGTAAGTVTFTENGVATSNVSGGGNLAAIINSSGAAQVTVVYTYTMSNALQPGDYTIVQATQPSGYIAGKLSSNGAVLNTPPSVRVIPVTILPGQTNYPNNEFGQIKVSSLSGYVYYDISSGGYNDGIKQPGEAGLAGVTITLDGHDDNGPVHAVLQTDANGFYNFTNLRPGNYTITETPPPGAVEGKDTIGTPGGTTLHDQFTNINLPQGFDGTNNNFALLKYGSLGGTVYLDVSAAGANNGVQDPGEPGIAGVTVVLNAIDYAGHPFTITTTTDANGNYLFTNLTPGTYSLVETKPPQYLDGKDTLGDHGGQVSQGMFSGIVLEAAANGKSYNFGHLLPSILSGYVYLDTSPTGFNDGIKEPDEPGIAGVLITLTGTSDQGPVSLQATTDANGFYSFAGLRSGTYQLAETPPPNLIDGKATIGSQGGQAGKDLLYNIHLPWNSSGTNNNFAALTPVITPPPVISSAHSPPPLVNNPNPSTPAQIPIVSKAQLTGLGNAGGNPSFFADARFINTVYHVILNRDADAAGLAGWMSFLRTGGTRSQLVRLIWQSGEHRTDEVLTWFRDINATPSQAVLTSYVNQLLNGATEVQVATAIYASANQTVTAATWNQSFVATAYLTLLGRGAGPSEIQGWVTLLQSGWTFTDVITVFLTSAEFTSDIGA
jgi:hypothetical protein